MRRCVISKIPHSKTGDYRRQVYQPYPVLQVNGVLNVSKPDLIGRDDDVMLTCHDLISFLRSVAMQQFLDLTTLSRTGVAILASRDAGPLAGRYWASLIAATLTLALAFGAAPVASLLGVLPQSYIFALAGLAILSSFQDALERAFGGVLKFGALVAFVTAATPFAFVGITSAFWAVVAGLLASSIAEREALLKVWKEKSD